jgi:hypothetical protein
MHFNLSAFLKVANLVVGPVLAASGVPTALIPIVQHGLADAELASSNRDVPLTGAEKKAIVMDAVATGIAGVNTVKPNAISSDVVPTVSQGIDVAVSTINIVNKAKTGAAPVVPTL